MIRLIATEATHSGTALRQQNSLGSLKWNSALWPARIEGEVDDQGPWITDCRN